MIWQFIVNGVITGMIYGVVALGFALVYNTTRIFHIAYAAIYMVAPYLLMFSMQSLGLPLFVSILLAVLGTILIGSAVDILIYSPLAKRNSSSNVIMVSSIGAMIIIINVVALIFGNETKIINPGVSQSITIGKILVTYTQVFQFVTALFLFFLFFIFLKFWIFGIITRA